MKTLKIMHLLSLYFRTLMPPAVVPVIVPFSFGDSAVDAGANVQISCVVSFGDLPLSITWSFHGVDSTKRRQADITTMKMGSRGSALIIESVNFEHNGFYTCSAKNGVGVANYTSELIVNGKMCLSYFRAFHASCAAL